MPLVIIMATLAGSHSLPALELEKMLAFATADSVRIELAPSAGEDFAGVEFQAAITQAGTGRLLWQGSLGQGAPDAARGACFSKAISGLKPELWSPEFSRSLPPPGHRDQGRKDAGRQDCSHGLPFLRDSGRPVPSEWPSGVSARHRDQPAGAGHTAGSRRIARVCRGVRALPEIAAREHLPPLYRRVAGLVRCVRRAGHDDVCRDTTARPRGRTRENAPRRKTSTAALPATGSSSRATCRIRAS